MGGWIRSNILKRILILGAGEAGRMVAAEAAASPELKIKIIAFLDDDTSLHETKVEGIKVLGPTSLLPDLVQKKKIDEVMIAIPSAEGPLVRRLLQVCRQAGIPFKLIPGIREIIKGDARFSHSRPINPNDLLGRESVDLMDSPVRDLLENRIVLITGAGGSIGREIARQVAALNPSHLLLLGRGENSIFEIHNEIQSSFPSLEINSIIADIRDREEILRIAAREKPQVIYHAAAHKHVPLMERFPREAYLNNVKGTRNIIEAAVAAGSGQMVMLSTDKAVDPCSIMGASKRIAELLVLKAHKSYNNTHFISVRFGNVLGSRGSVVSVFRRQIEKGGPVTVTSPEVTRYFMTIHEASALVIQASAVGQGGEIFILNMGESLEIVELARSIIRLHGFEPDREIPIKFTGLRPGEKLHEKLMSEQEAQFSEPGEQFVVLRPKIPADLNIDSILQNMDRLAEAGDEAVLAEKMLTFSKQWGDIL